MSYAVPVTSDAERELALRLQQQELVASFGLFALRAAELEGILDQACEVAARGLGTIYAKVLSFRPATQDFLLCNGVGWRDGVVGHAVLGADLASPAGFALRTKMPVVSNHLGDETRFRTPTVLAEHGIRRAINVIVETDGDVPFGVLEADSSGRDPFTMHDLSFMQSLANVLSAAINRQSQLAAQQRLLRDKDVLMQEIHHRVKNNLQLVHTMLNLQARDIAGGDAKSQLQDAASRIMSIAAVHRRLHEEGAVERVDMAPYLQGLLADISKSQGVAGRQILLEMAAMQLASEHATPIGLIVVEMVTNALKYGDGPIKVRLLRTDSGADVLVEDAGPGFPAGFDPRSRASLGMRLIAALARTQDPIQVSREGDSTVVTVRVAFPEKASLA